MSLTKTPAIHPSSPERRQVSPLSPPSTPLESGPEKMLGYVPSQRDTNSDMRPGMPSKSTAQPSVEDVRQSTAPSIRPLQGMAQLQRRRAREAGTRERAGGRPRPRARHGNDLFLVQLMTEIEEESQKASDVDHFAKVCPLHSSSRRPAC